MRINVSLRFFLTEIGKKKRDQARKGVIAFNKLIYDRVPPEKLQVFFEVMSSVNQVLEVDAGEILKNNLEKKCISGYIY